MRKKLSSDSVSFETQEDSEAVVPEPTSQSPLSDADLPDVNPSVRRYPDQERCEPDRYSK